MTYLIYEFTSQLTADAALSAINQMAESYWTGQGYTILNGELVGKKNGVDNPNAAHTLTWDTVKLSPDGSFYFASLSNEALFANGTQQLIDAGFVFTEKLFPSEWEVLSGL